MCAIVALFDNSVSRLVERWDNMKQLEQCWKRSGRNERECLEGKSKIWSRQLRLEEYHKQFVHKTVYTSQGSVSLCCILPDLHNQNTEGNICVVESRHRPDKMIQSQPSSR